MAERSPERLAGREKMRGYIDAIGPLLFGAIVVSVAWSYLIQPTDSTDRSWRDRSGVRLHVDTETGVEYLSVSGGGITPRLDSQGNLMVNTGYRDE